MDNVMKLNELLVICNESIYTESIYRSIFEYNEYKLPEPIDSGSIILDIGSHYGCFSYFAHEKGYRNIICYEADPNNYNLSLDILRNRNIQVNNKAVWRSDKDTDFLFLEESIGNSAGGNVIFKDTGNKINTVSLDSIIDDIYSKYNRNISFLKIDAESSEFPILLTSKKLDRIDVISGEFHEVGGLYDSNKIPDQNKITGYDSYTIYDLLRYLTLNGFKCSYVRDRFTQFGHFFATRV